MGSQRRAEDAAAPRARTHRAGCQRRADDVDSGSLSRRRARRIDIAPADARMTAPHPHRISRAVLLERLPGYVGQVLLVAFVVAVGWRGVANFVANLHALGVSAGWG